MSDENVVNKTEGYEGWVIILKIVTIILPIQNVSKSIIVREDWWMWQQRLMVFHFKFKKKWDYAANSISRSSRRPLIIKYKGFNHQVGKI